MSDLTTLNLDELAQIRQGADDEIQAARAKKIAVRDEIARREVVAIAEGLSPSQLEVLRQHIGSVGGIDAGEMGGLS